MIQSTKAEFWQHCVEREFSLFFLLAHHHQIPYMKFSPAINMQVTYNTCMHPQAPKASAVADYHSFLYFSTSTVCSIRGWAQGTYSIRSRNASAFKTALDRLARLGLLLKWTPFSSWIIFSSSHTTATIHKVFRPVSTHSIARPLVFRAYR